MHTDLVLNALEHVLYDRQLSHSKSSAWSLTEELATL